MHEPNRNRSTSQRHKQFIVLNNVLNQSETNLHMKNQSPTLDTVCHTCSNNLNLQKSQEYHPLPLSLTSPLSKEK